MTAQDIIIKPLMTEKSYDGIQVKKYTFAVSKKANKTQIKLAIQELFPEAQVESVRTVNYSGKLKRQGKTEGRTASYKKAVVQLKANSKPIAFFENLA